MFFLSVHSGAFRLLNGIRVNLPRTGVSLLLGWRFHLVDEWRLNLFIFVLNSVDSIEEIVFVLGWKLVLLLHHSLE